MKTSWLVLMGLMGLAAYGAEPAGVMSEEFRLAQDGDVSALVR